MALVEFAFIAPVLVVLLLGIVDFGINLSNQISLRQGAREGARQGVVANFGTTTSCGATFTTPGSTNMQKLICLTKARSDLTATNVSVAIRFDPGSSSYPAGTSTPPVGNGLLVCTAAPLQSLSKLFSPALDGKYFKTKTVMRIEKASGVAESQANEADPTGANWSWCTP
ncbi:pilus assembly protein [Aquihabitans sp. G128]|uniref:TadE family protein n=1 Tax=Aquihabitans sp. G128 TaxID=2849779 RepID=UPI001C2226AE|nr:TadE family protein [Aquihabitans sp. G128]QXC59378.1 pilus assembly protein [Aquihabitans sp. G128]